MKKEPLQNMMKNSFVVKYVNVPANNIVMTRIMITITITTITMKIETTIPPAQSV
jgi:hypothetical protein